jgi:peptide/nickel transport system permease protein
MFRPLARRLLTGGLTLFLVTVLVFVLIQWTAGDPLAEAADAGFSRRMPPEAQAELRRVYHLDQPVHRQYLLWLGDALRGDLGRSLHDRRPVSEKIGERLGTTLTLNIVSLLLMAGLAVPLGAAAALRPGSITDRLGAAIGYLLYALPLFWAGLLLQILFGLRLEWLPLAGLSSVGAEELGSVARLWDRAEHLVLPVLALSYG